MADTETENPLGYVDKRRNPKGQEVGNANGNAFAGAVGDASNYASVAGLRARLTAVNPTYFNATRLNAMTKNDLVYAVRLADDAVGIR